MKPHYLFCLALLAASAAAQNRTSSISGWVEAEPGNRVHYARHIAFAGGDVRFEGKPVTGAPYSAEAVTEVVQTLADGNKIRRENRTLIQRDNEGRTRREETLQAVGPWSTDETHRMIFINDPVAHVQYILNPQDQTGHKIDMPDMSSAGLHRFDFHRESHSSNITIRSAPGAPVDATQNKGVSVDRRVVVEHSGSAESSSESSASTSSSYEGLPKSGYEGLPKPGDTTEESLGKRMIEGLESTGTRYTTVLDADEIGADRDIEIVYERWESPELGVDLLTKREDPRFGVTTYRLTNISRAEPLPSAFEPPADYDIQDNIGGDPPLGH